MNLNLISVASLTLDHDNNLVPQVDIFANGLRINSDGKLTSNVVIGDIDKQMNGHLGYFIHAPEYVCGVYLVLKNTFDVNTNINIEVTAYNAQMALIQGLHEMLLNNEVEFRQTIIDNGINSGFNMLDLNYFYNGLHEFKNVAVVTKYSDMLKELRYSNYSNDAKIDGVNTPIYDLILNSAMYKK